MEETPKLSRRQLYAMETQRAILEAARKLFAERGYFATKVDDIAEAAGVAPATVYAVPGNKQGLVKELIRQWSADPLIQASQAHRATLTDPREIIDELASVTRRMRERWADVVWILLTTAPHDAEVAAEFKEATDYYRAGVNLAADRLAEVGSLRPGLVLARARDILWFYFGYGSYLVLHNQNGWSYEDAEHWLAEQAAREVLPES